MKLKIIILTITIFFSFFLLVILNRAQGQNIGINTTGAAPNASALLDIDAAPGNSKGLLIPRLTTAQMNAIVSPATGLIIYNTDCNTFNYFNGSTWIAIGNTGSLSAPGAITGSTTPCQNATGIAYSITAVTGATGYNWTVPTGASVATGQGTISITVNFATTDGNVCVTASNACGTSNASCTAITLQSAPAAPTATAASNIAQTSFDANWNASAGATTYYLDVATDVSFTSFVTGYINLNVGNVVTYSVNTNLTCATTYYYRVRADNSCGISANSNTITVTSATCCLWVQKADHSGGAIYGSTAFSIGTKGYFSCGYGPCGYVQTWEWDQATNVWTQKADYPSANSAYLGVGFSIGTKGYRGTGYTGCSGNRSADFYEFDPVANTWTPKSNVPVPRYTAVGFSIGGKGYIGGGDNFGALNDFYEYDPATDVWTPKANYPGVGRTGCTSFSIGTIGYVGMGDGGGGAQQDFWEYNPATDIWTQKANFGGGIRSGATGFSTGTKGYVACGYNAGYKNDFWEYNPATDTWTQLCNFGGAARSDTENGFTIGTKGYVGTGYSGSGGLQDFWEITLQ